MPDSATKRDPRIDPRAGDVLAYRGRPLDHYKVITNSGTWVTDTPVSPSHCDFGEELHNRLVDWRQLFADAEVIAEAPDGR